MTTPPPIKISDEIARAFVEAYDDGCCNDSSADFCCTRYALEAVAPLIAAQVLRPNVDLPMEIRGDGPCDDCGTADNIIWFTDNVLWNTVIRYPDAPPDPFLCVPCFVRRVHEAGLAPTGWRLVPDWHWETLKEYGRRKRAENGRERSPATGGVIDSSQVYLVGENGPPPLVMPERPSPRSYAAGGEAAAQIVEGVASRWSDTADRREAVGQFATIVVEAIRDVLKTYRATAPGRSLTEDAP